MSLSEYLIEEIRTWDVVELPQRAFHGCRHDDIGIDILNLKISGNKWCSIDAAYAGDYAWHHTRNHQAVPYILEVLMTEQLTGIQRPKHLNGEAWAPFLGKCFPQYSGYELSREFARSIVAHIKVALGNNINGYISYGGDEIIVTDTERYLVVESSLKLPMEKTEYLKIKGGVYA
ncbi:hypothetical protein [Alteromonas sp. CyTr2]|uniref:hypothetical protein n=1 Tax=Alteromonas sp. CyTr2 TaxID=2935039 RepID=UPI00248E1D4C|nr:hypothetical protein [Alteromonas sp. CyTr2]